MKVVINDCFGGFGLSSKAFEMFLERKNIEFEKVPSKYPIAGNEYDYFEKGKVGVEDSYLSPYELINDRSDSDLIAVIEELGNEANGWAAELKIVEIPDDVKWHIHEYDGIEHVAENHRTWS